MERLRRAVQGRPGAVGLGLFVVASAALSAHDASAQTPDGSGGTSAPEIVAARELFREGTADADAGRFADGLAKFKRVAAVKETAAVRFNIARCEEALGKTGAALADFELAEREAALDTKAGGAEDVGKLALARADAVRPKVPRLTLVASSPALDGMTLSLDGGKLALASLGVALPVDPGLHVVDATARAMSPFHVEVTLAQAEAKSVRLSFAPAPAPASSPEPAPLVQAGSSQRTWGWIAVAAGGALGIGSIALLALHDSGVSNLNGECPNGRCPASQESAIEGTESSARTDETVSIVLVAASALAIGGGIALVATSPSASKSAAVSAGAQGAPAGLTVGGRF